MTSIKSSILFIISAVIVNVTCDPTFGGAKELVLVNVLYRHGDRTPIATYPTDPYRNVSNWPVGWGQLTNKGKEQHYELGQWLRQRYNHFLPKTYSRNDIYVQSTDVDRTLMSAESNLAGLYPPTHKQKWHHDLLWQPIPVHTIPEEDDMVLAARYPCPKYDEELKNVLNSDEMQSLNKKNKKLYDYLSKHANVTVYDVISLEYLYDTLHVEDMNNMTLPEWTKGVYPEQMEHLAAYSFTVQTKTKLQKRLKTGPLLEEMVSNMKKAVHNDAEKPKKFYMYSAHDTTVANLLMTLGVYDLHNPPYTATVLIELILRHGNYSVVVSYRNSSEEPAVLTIPGCIPICPYDKFVSLTKPYIPKDWGKECQTSEVYQFQLNAVSIIALSCSGLLAMLLTSSILFSFLYWRRRKSAAYYYHHIHNEG